MLSPELLNGAGEMIFNFLHILILCLHFVAKALHKQKLELTAQAGWTKASTAV
jgi:hypothetical protein